MTGGRKSNLHLEGKSQAQKAAGTWLRACSPICKNPLLLLSKWDCHMASALLALPASPRTKAEASERKTRCPFLHHNARAPGDDLSPHSARRLTPTHGGAARQEQNDDFWSGPDTSHDLPSSSAVLALQAARNCCASLLWKQLQARGKGGVPPGHSQAVKWACRATATPRSVIYGAGPAG